MKNLQQVAIAVIAFAGTQDVFSFRISGPETDWQSPKLELERFMAAVDMALDRLDPWSLQIMAANMLDSHLTHVEMGMDFDEADIPGILASCEFSQLRSI